MKIIRLIENDSNPLSFHDLNNVKVHVLVNISLLEDVHKTEICIFLANIFYLIFVIKKFALS